jgi:hypothetical protein
MKCRLADWDEEEPRADWWAYQREYADAYAALSGTTELVEALREAVDVLERIPYGDWPGKMYSGKTVAANALICRARKALTLHDRALGK